MTIPLYELLDLLSKAYASLRRHKYAPWTGPEISEHMRGASVGIAERFQAEAVERALSNGDSLQHIVLGAAFNLGQSHLPGIVTWNQAAARFLLERVLKDLDPKSQHAQDLQQALNLMIYPPE